MFPDFDSLKTHIAKHADLIRPKFEIVFKSLEADLVDYGQWTKAEGGYFVSFESEPGLASEMIKLAAEAGVKLIPAGAPLRQ